jgi:uncharacterized protein YjbI with pentapeptide repeats
MSASLQNADLEFTSLDRADLRSADLTGANLTLTNLSEAVFNCDSLRTAGLNGNTSQFHIVNNSESVEISDCKDSR